jgi:hypothetical protein
MRCTRCGGLIVVESYADGELNDGSAALGALRCVKCGALVDVRILSNRVARRSQGLELAELRRGDQNLTGRVP